VGVCIILGDHGSIHFGVYSFLESLAMPIDQYLNHIDEA